MTQTIDPELVERMVAHFRAVERQFKGRSTTNGDLGDEALAIASLLPPPPDPDIVEARMLAADDRDDADAIKAIMSGRWDGDSQVKFRFEGIKRGRELERRDRDAGKIDLAAACREAERS